MSSSPTTEKIRLILEQDRLWTAYALADLDPVYAEGANWFVEANAAILFYQALQPPVLFIYGPSDAISRLITKVPQGPVQFMVREHSREALMQRLAISREVEMWRMALDPKQFKPIPVNANCRRLGPADLAPVDKLIEGQPDQPDAFSSFQLKHGVFYGQWQDSALVAMAGTHVLSKSLDVAAVGNVFTHPDYRGHGYGRKVSAAVVADLLNQGLGTIVLNVAQNNEAALKIYSDLGFWPVYGYYEGVGTIQPKK